MFQFTKVKITQAAQGGHRIQPRTGDVLELHVGRTDDLSATIDYGVYQIQYILCDIFNDLMSFMDMEGKPIVILDGHEGTDALLKNLVILADPNPKAEKQVLDGNANMGDFV